MTKHTQVFTREPRESNEERTSERRLSADEQRARAAYLRAIGKTELNDDGG